MSAIGRTAPPCAEGFTLIEILIACILLGVGVTSVIGLLLVSLQRSRQVTAMTTMGPLATAAASLYMANQQSGTVDLPNSNGADAFSFTSPFALRIERSTASGGETDANGLVTLKISLYDTPERRDAEQGALGIMYIRQYGRTP